MMTILVCLLWALAAAICWIVVSDWDNVEQKSEQLRRDNDMRKP
jgi:hypothetical protein